MNDFFRRVIISLVLPFAFIVGFPIAAVLFYNINRISWLREVPLSYMASLIGLLLIALGLVHIMNTIPLFLKQSEGTIMPWEPTAELIVKGVYRYVRNPMIHKSKEEGNNPVMPPSKLRSSGPFDKLRAAELFRYEVQEKKLFCL